MVDAAAFIAEATDAVADAAAADVESAIDTPTPSTAAPPTEAGE